MAIDPVSIVAGTLNQGFRFGSTLSESKTRREESRERVKKAPLDFLAQNIQSKSAESIQKEKTKQVVVFSIIGLVLVGGLILALKKKK